MSGVQQWWGDVTVLALGLLVVAAVAAAAGVRRRIGRGVTPSRAWPVTIAEVAMVAGTVPWLWLATRSVDLPPGTVRWYLVPLSDLRAQLSGPASEIALQVGANLLVLFALGAGLPVRFAGLARPGRLLAVGLLAALAVEVGQQVVAHGRVFSVDDVLLNGVGCLLGGVCTVRWWERRTPVAT